MPFGISLPSPVKTLTAMKPLTRLSARSRSSSVAAVTRSPLNSTAEHDGEETQRTKRIRRVTRIKEEEVPNGVDSDDKFIRPPDIEDFSYVKKSSSCQEQSTSVQSVKAISAVTVSKVKAPENWEKLLEGIKKMRCLEDAPVDTKGCEKAGKLLPPKERRFAVLISSMLSSQTKDEVTHGAVERLSENGLLDPEAIVKTDEATIRDLIRPVCDGQLCRICRLIN